MEIQDQVIVVTGGGSGIGRALCERFAADGARAVVVADLDAEAARQVAAAIGAKAQARALNVGIEEQVQAMVAEVSAQHGRIDLFCSNAGVIVRADEDAANEHWQRHWDVNVMAHVYAARAVLPQMLARGSGYLLNTASAAGLLSQVNSAPYSVTKHAAVAFAEWLSIAHGERGIRVSCLCPQGVDTPMLRGAGAGMGRKSFLVEGALTAERVAECVVEGLRREEFLILPHAEVLGFFQRKATDYERWLRGMRRLRDKVMSNGA